MNTTQSRFAAPALVALAVAAVAALALPATVEAQPELGESELAQVFVYSGGVELRPLRDYRQAIVTVSGNDYDRRLTFGPGERIDIGTTDAEGAQLSDGVYGWELELLPDEATALELKIEATLNGGIAPEPWPRQAGSFRIAGGVVASPDVDEITRQPERLDSGLDSGSQGLRSFSRGEAQLDDDASTGSLEEYEVEVQAAVARQTPAAAPGLGREGLERSDAAAEALGGSPEELASDQARQLMRQSGEAPADRRTTSSDGADGRPRADEDQ